MARSSLQVKFAEIPAEGLRVDVDDVSWFPDGEVARHGIPKAVVSLERKGERVVVAGVVDVSLVLTCDRCLMEFARPSKVVFRLILEVAVPGQSSDDHQQVDFENDPDGFELVVIDGPVVDLGELLYQQMLLSLPLRVLCRTDCRGICGGCGASLNAEECDCGDVPGSPPFAALGRLLKNKK